MELRHIATREGKLYTFLRQELGMSAGLMNRLKWQDKIWVNGKPEHTDYFLRPGDEILVRLEENAPDYPAQQGELVILYEDDHLLAVHKPAGMLIHPSRSCNTGTLANFVAGYYEKTGQPSAFHPVTRLDRDTFGVVLLAKNAYVHMAMQNTPMQKMYHALVHRGPKEERGQIAAPIARRPLPSLLRYVDGEGKPSVTEFQVLERRGEVCKIALYPITGRTHQLRVHCAYKGFPILGDPQYGSEESKALSARLKFEGQRLCAKDLTFDHPVTGEHLEIITPVEV